MKQIIIDTYPQYGINETIKKLDLTDESKYDVQHMASKLKLKRIGKYFTPEDIQYLKENYAKESVDDICKYLSKNKSAVTHIASKLGLSNDIYYYSDDDIQFIKDNYDVLTNNEIADALHKTIFAIETKINKLGLSQVKAWTDAEIKTLKEVYPYYTNKKIVCDFLPKRNIKSIATMAHKFDLVKSKQKSVKWYDMDDMIKDLYSVAKNIGRTPYYNELEQYNLPSETTYRRYFGTYRKACMEAGLLPNSTKIGKQNATCSISKNGSICLSISENIICDYMDNHNIKYEKEPYYRDYINDKRCGYKRFDWKVENYFIEYFGLIGYKSYEKKMNDKINICKDNNINLIALYPKDLNCLDVKLHILLQ